MRWVQRQGHRRRCLRARKGKEAASETERLILSEWKTIAEEETITVSEREPDGGRKETKRAPTEGRKGDVVLRSL